MPTILQSWCDSIDIDIKSVESAEKNLKFIEKKYLTKAKYKVIRGDSRFLSNMVKESDGIATEPYLGPYLRHIPSIKEAMKTLRFLGRDT